MDSTDCFLEILSAYQSSDSGCPVSYTHLDVYKRQTYSYPPGHERQRPKLLP